MRVLFSNDADLAGEYKVQRVLSVHLRFHQTDLIREFLNQFDQGDRQALVPFPQDERHLDRLVFDTLQIGFLNVFVIHKDVVDASSTGLLAMVSILQSAVCVHRFSWVPHPGGVLRSKCGAATQHLSLPFPPPLLQSSAVPGLVAIVGRPNVGKSALFNRIVGRRIAIVHDQPGVTRDRISAQAEWRGNLFNVVDTGGIGLMAGEKAQEIITRAAFEQVELAVEAADVLVLVVNVQEGILPLDDEVSRLLRKSGKPVLVAINKVDHQTNHPGIAEFSDLGFPRMFPISAIHSRGIDALMDAIGSHLPQPEPGTAPAPPRPEPRSRPISMADGGPVKLAVVGRPNVGKSSLINALVQSDRVVVSDIPGTTRDSIDVPFEVDTAGVRQSYLLIDTDGMRKSRRVQDSIEFFSVKRAEDSIERSDIAVLVMDAEQGVSVQDKKIADRIVEGHKGCILVINKWDLMEKSVQKARMELLKQRSKGKRSGKEPMSTLAEFGEWVQKNLFFLDYAPVIFTSAKSGFHLERFLESVRYVTAQMLQKVPTGLLNRALKDAMTRQLPSVHGGQRLKFYYATQVKAAPPTFVLFVNHKELMTDHYRKYLCASLRKSFGFEGCPIVLVAKPRPKTIAPIRKWDVVKGSPSGRRTSVSKEAGSTGERIRSKDTSFSWERKRSTPTPSPARNKHRRTVQTSSRHKASSKPETSFRAGDRVQRASEPRRKGAPKSAPTAARKGRRRKPSLRPRGRK